MPDTPDVADAPEAADTPDVPDTPDTADVADAPEAADTPDVPDAPDAPDVADTPDVPDAPEAADTPGTPDTPDVADVPDAPDVSDVPDAPDTPELADTPDAPDVADTPDSADAPDSPEVIDTSDADVVAASAATAGLARLTIDPTTDVSIDGLTRTPRSYRSNRFEFISDGDGLTRAAHFEINESATGLTRGSAEVQAQGDAADNGLATDHGGHIVAHRFASDQGDINMFPQDAQFNNSAYKRLENELHTWVQNGFQVEGHTTLDIPPGSLRPDSVTVDYVVTNPQTGEIVHWRAVEFQNQAGQTYNRVPTGQIRAEHGATHELHVRPPSDVPDNGQPPGAGGP